MADEQDKSQKTEQPTPHRLEKARKEGQIALSKEVNHWFILLTVAIMLVYVFPTTFRKLTHTLSFYLEHVAQLPTSGGDLIQLAKQSLLDLGGIFFLPILFLIAAAIAAGLSQTRGVVSLKGMKPKLEKISIMKGLSRTFGSKALVEFFKNFIKLAIIAAIAYFVMKPEFHSLHSMPQMGALDIMTKLAESLLKLLIVVVSVITVIAALDYGYQKYKFLQELKMSKQEIKEEYKEIDGDPHIKARLRQLREEKARQRMIQDVPGATVVMTNPTHYAVALKYEVDGTDAPTVIAKGIEAVALKIREVADENDIPIVENPPLTRALYANVKIGEEIPTEYFEATARVIRYIFGYDKHYLAHLDDGIDETKH